MTPGIVLGRYSVNNTITVSEAARKIGRDPGELFGYTYLKTSGSAGVPQRFWLYSALTDEEAARVPDTYLRKIIPSD